MISLGFEWLQENGILVALGWMLLANALALGTKSMKIGALVAMLITAPIIVVAIITGQGWIFGFPILLLMCLQMRWAFFFIRRLFFGEPRVD